MERVHDLVGVHPGEVMANEAHLELAVARPRPEHRGVGAHVLVLPEVQHRRAVDRDAVHPTRVAVAHLRHDAVEDVVVGVGQRVLNAHPLQAVLLQQGGVSFHSLGPEPRAPDAQVQPRPRPHAGDVGRGRWRGVRGQSRPLDPVLHLPLGQMRVEPGNREVAPHVDMDFQPRLEQELRVAGEGVRVMQRDGQREARRC